MSNDDSSTNRLHLAWVGGMVYHGAMIARNPHFTFVGYQICRQARGEAEANYSGAYHYPWTHVNYLKYWPFGNVFSAAEMCTPVSSRHLLECRKSSFPDDYIV